MPLFGSLIKRTLGFGERLQQIEQRIPPAHHQRRTLRRLLRKAQHTAFGQHYQFHDMLHDSGFLERYRASVPFFSYDEMYEKWWHRSLQGEENVSWRGPVKYFAQSSGTSGAPSKKIPVTEDMMRAMRRGGLKMFFALTHFDVQPELFTKPMMMLGGTSNLQDQGGYFVGDLSGINASKPPFWLRPYYKPGTTISRIPDWDARIQQIVLSAPNWDIGFLVGIPSWLQLMMERIIDHYKLDTIHDIWPNLEVFVHGGIHFEPYRRGFEQLLAHPLIYMDSYLASEGFIAFQDRPATRSMKLLLNQGIYFEFIPFHEAHFDAEGNLRDRPLALRIDEVEVGEEYALVLSTCAGAWRYLLGDTVRFTDTRRAEIVITGRTKHFLSVCGEHLSVENMNEGVRHVEQQLHCSIPEFTVCAVRHGNHFAHHWYLGASPQVGQAAAQTQLDRRLRAVNDDYDIERNHVLGAPQVEVIDPALFYQYQARLGKIGGQHKFPRVMKAEAFAAWEAFLREQQGQTRTNPML